MFQLLSAESYKLRKGKSFFVSVIVMAGSVLLMYGMLALVNSVHNGDVQNGTAGIVVTVDEAGLEPGSIWEQTSPMEMLRQIFSGGLVACILAVYVSIFTIYEYTGGMVKNIVGKGHSRTVIFLSRFMTAILSSELITVTGIAATLLYGWFFMGSRAFSGDFWHNLCIYCVLQLLLVIPLAAIYMLIGEISRNLAAGISISIGVYTLPLLLLGGLDMACRDYGFLPSQFWLISRSDSCPTEHFTSGYITETVLVAAVWFFAAAVLGIWHFNKTDIK